MYPLNYFLAFLLAGMVMAIYGIKRDCLVIFLSMIYAYSTTTARKQNGINVKLLPDFVNLTHLATEFALTCGSAYAFCNPGVLPFKLPEVFNKDCSIRNCMNNCAQSRSCSPDVKFAFLNVSCLSTDLYTTRKEIIHTYNMVASCSDAASYYALLCHNIDDINEFNFSNETFRPVISRLTNICYRNKFCASCHNDDLDLIPFKLDLKCDNFFDINSFSSLQEMWTAIKISNCSVSYVPPYIDGMSATSCSLTSTSVQRRCNVSGLWSTYDPQIEWACQNFNSLTYRGYSNIFCYICNPSLASTVERTVIGSCNVTGDWRVRDPEIERGCLSLPTVVRTYPFKNRFCHMCNGYLTEFRTFGNLSIFVQNAPASVSTNFYHGTFGTPNLGLENRTEINERFKESFNVNVSVFSINALQEVGKFCGFTSFCSESYEPSHHSISTACAFPCKRGKNCCKQLMSVFHQCASDRPRDFFTEKCDSISENDILTAVPVRSRTTKRFYKNMYCARCHNDIKFDLIPFNIVCPKPLEASLIISFSDLQEIYRNHDCKLTIIRSSPSDCGNAINSINTCRNRAHWAQYNKGVLQNCESEDLINLKFEPVCFNGSQYRNIFCLICNRDWVDTAEDVISECNITGQWSQNNSVVKEKCQTEPAYPGWYPFKNIYCAACNSATEETISGSYYITYSQESVIVCSGFGCLLTNAPYRVLFSLTDLEFPAIGETGNPLEEFCAAGKVLTNGKCQFVIEETAHLGYNVTFGLRIRNTSQSDWSGSDIQTLSAQVLNQYPVLKSTEALQLNVDIIDETDLNNTAFPANESKEMELRVNAVLFVVKTHNRTQIEMALYAMSSRETILNIFLRGQVLTVEIYPIYHQVACSSVFYSNGKHQPYESDEANETNIDKTTASKHQYRVQTFNDTEIFNKSVTFLAVNKLLFCVLTKIDTDMDEVIETLCLRNITFQMSDDHANIYLCVDDWKAITSDNVSMATDPLRLSYGIFSMTCTLLSLLCLILTFITYLILKSLRTIPGINNMNLVFALFWAQLFLQFGLWRTGNQTVCVFLGIATHYFWLASFCAMNVCSYHMFKVFHNPMMVSRDINQRIGIFYSLYVFIAPFVFVSIFSLVISIESDLKDIGYGQNICFLSDHVYIVIMFISPACLIIVINAVFCSIAYWHIRSTSRLEGTADRNDFKIYLKLTTVTGTAWIFLFIDTLSPLSVFSFVATLAGALQGVYIFAAFICNAKVWSLYKCRFKRKTLGQQFPKKQTWSAIKLQSSTVSSERIQKQSESSKETFV